MIPHGIMSGNLVLPDRTLLEIRMLELSGSGFTFRLSKKYASETVTECTGIRLRFSMDRENRFLYLSGEDIRITEEVSGTFWKEYRLETESLSYRQAAEQLTGEYLEYVRRKLSLSDGELAEQMTGYPAEEEQQISGSFEEQREAWFQEAADRRRTCGDGWFREITRYPEIGLCADRPERYRMILDSESSDAFVSRYLETMKIGEPVPVSALLLGNPWCPHLNPQPQEWGELIRRGLRWGMRPAVVLPPFGETGSPETVLQVLGELAGSMEEPLRVIVNDWGTARILREMKNEKLELTLGCLLNRYRKDVRLSYLKLSSEELHRLGQTQLETSFYRDFLEEQGIRGVMWESCGYERDYPGGFQNAARIPFYTMNTAGDCTLAAVCENGDRGMQRSMKSCPEYCRKTAFLYPDFLTMTGRYNSLFGYDRRILWDEKELRRMREQGVQTIWLSSL